MCKQNIALLMLIWDWYKYSTKNKGQLLSIARKTFYSSFSFVFFSFPAVLQCCTPPTHMDPLSGCASPTASTYTHCSYFQVSKRNLKAAARGPLEVCMLTSEVYDVFEQQTLLLCHTASYYSIPSSFRHGLPYDEVEKHDKLKPPWVHH